MNRHKPEGFRPGAILPSTSSRMATSSFER
jgi:hypothetical protein